MPKEIEKKDHEKMELVKYKKIDDAYNLMKKRPNLNKLFY